MLGHVDPRLARQLGKSALVSEARHASNHRLLRAFTTRSSRMTLACGFDHVLQTECAFSVEHETATTPTASFFPPWPSQGNRFA